MNNSPLASRVNEDRTFSLCEGLHLIFCFPFRNCHLINLSFLSDWSVHNLRALESDNKEILWTSNRSIVRFLGFKIGKDPVGSTRLHSVLLVFTWTTGTLSGWLMSAATKAAIKGLVWRKNCHFTTDTFGISDSQNPSFNEFYAVQKRRSTDLRL